MAYATILTSPDGADWTVEPNAWDTSGDGAAVADNGSLTVGGGGGRFGPTAQTTTDGILWTPENVTGVDLVTLATVVQSVDALCYDGTDWYAGGASSGSGPLISVSAAATAPWTRSLSLTIQSGVSRPVCGAMCLYGGSVYAAGRDLVAPVGSIFNAMAVESGGVWTGVSTGFDAAGINQQSGQIFGLATDGTTILAVGLDKAGNGRVQAGPAWADVSTPFSGAGPAPNGCAYLNGTWFIFDATSGTLATSSTATGTYTVQTTTLDGDEINSGAYDSGLYVFVGQGLDGHVVMTSTNPVGGPYTERSTPIDNAGFHSTLNAVCWSATAGLWVAVGGGIITVPSAAWILGLQWGGP